MGKIGNPTRLVLQLAIHVSSAISVSSASKAEGPQPHSHYCLKGIVTKVPTQPKPADMEVPTTEKLVYTQTWMSVLWPTGLVERRPIKPQNLSRQVKLIN